MGLIIRIWERLTHGLWFRPSIVALSLLALAIVVPMFEAEEHVDVPFLYGGGADTARTLLATIAGSLMTVLALVFSLTLIAMQLVSSQITPRAVRGFLGESTTQISAGSFVGIVLYCFVVMRHIRSARDDIAFEVPQISVTLGLVLGVVAMGLLLVFVNHIASWMQLANITQRIFRETRRAIDAWYPRRYAPIEHHAAPPEGDAIDVRSTNTGYIQFLATRNHRLDLPDEVSFVDLLVHTGDFVAKGDVLMKAWVTKADEEVCEDLASVVVVGAERDITQDAAFGLRQLADIALRALSPGINDPTTAAMCLNYLGALVAELGQRALEFHETSKKVRIPDRPFEAYVEEAFAEIIVFGAGQPRVMADVDRSLARCAAAVVGASERAEVIQRIRRRALEHAIREAPTSHDRATLQGLLDAATP